MVKQSTQQKQTMDCGNDNVPNIKDERSEHPLLAQEFSDFETNIPDNSPLESPDSRPETLESFLQAVERKAFVMARYTIGNQDDALDAVQDAMLKLCEKYSDRPSEEWAPLFYRILHNAMMDRHRPRGMNRLKQWVRRSSSEADIGNDQADQITDTMDSLESMLPGPQDQLATTQGTAKINDILKTLPTRQREVFLLRNWQGLSVKETAEAMQIAEGSVKTHLSRATTALKERLQAYEP